MLPHIEVCALRRRMHFIPMQVGGIRAEAPLEEGVDPTGENASLIWLKPRLLGCAPCTGQQSFKVWSGEIPQPRNAQVVPRVRSDLAATTAGTYRAFSPDSMSEVKRRQPKQRPGKKLSCNILVSVLTCEDGTRLQKPA